MGKNTRAVNKPDSAPGIVAVGDLEIVPVEARFGAGALWHTANTKFLVEQVSETVQGVLLAQDAFACSFRPTGMDSSLRTI
jgi:hypothetical protein